MFLLLLNIIWEHNFEIHRSVMLYFTLKYFGSLQQLLTKCKIPWKTLVFLWNGNWNKCNNNNNNHNVLMSQTTFMYLQAAFTIILILNGLLYGSEYWWWVIKCRKLDIKTFRYIMSTRLIVYETHIKRLWKLIIL